MRLLGKVNSQVQAHQLSHLLVKEGIANSYDSTAAAYQIWIQEEDDFERAEKLYQQFLKNPPPEDEPITVTKIKEPRSKVKIRVQHKLPRYGFSISNLIIVICAFLFLWNFFEEVNLYQQLGEPKEPTFIETSLEKSLLFDSLQNPWPGLEAHIVDHVPLQTDSLFKKIREGEYWRLFTPALMHATLLHILFNMAWLFLLGRQMEERIGKTRFILFILIVGIVANVAQYLVSGPSFMGFSAVVVGMVGFIWMRQKIAPWEGYPLPRPTILFVLVFVLAMFLIGLAAFWLHFFHWVEMPFVIANTAHIVGGVLGIALARIPLFSRRHHDRA